MPIDNCNAPLYNIRGQTVKTWGLDNTGLITYSINAQGFRNKNNYSDCPTYAFFGNSSIFGIGVNEDQILSSQFNNSQNFGLAGEYLNKDSVTNLENFLSSPLYNKEVKIAFFWVEREGQEDISKLITYVDSLDKNIINVSQTKKKYPGAVHLMPSIDSDVSRTHPGPKTHKVWPKTLDLLFNRVDNL